VVRGRIGLAKLNSPPSVPFDPYDKDGLTQSLWHKKSVSLSNYFTCTIFMRMLRGRGSVRVSDYTIFYPNI
jgi:hypothetical protein